MPPQFENQIPKKHTQLALLAIAMILVGILAVGYFVYQNQQTSISIENKNLLLRICPDEWIQNAIPPVEENTKGKEYYILKGDRKEIAEFDNQWVKNNCNLEKQIVY